MSIMKNVKAIRSEIGPSIILVAVTKNRTTEEIKEAVRVGVTDIGENRLRELPDLPGTVAKHFIGRLQSNKVRDVVKLFDMIQSVDSLKLAQKIDSECNEIGKVMPVLIQVNTSNEPQKGGVTPKEVEALVSDASKLKNIHLRGLMTLAVHSADESKVRSCFKKLRQLFDQIKNSSLELRDSSFNILSMGMSEDYRIAIQEGATMIRLGRRIFG